MFLTSFKPSKSKFLSRQEWNLIHKLNVWSELIIKLCFWIQEHIRVHQRLFFQYIVRFSKLRQVVNIDSFFLFPQGKDPSSFHFENGRDLFRFSCNTLQIEIFEKKKSRLDLNYDGIKNQFEFSNSATFKTPIRTRRSTF